MEGLEVSEINYSQVDDNNRYDSEYFKKIFLESEEKLKSRDYFRVGSNFKVTDGEHGSVEFQENGIKYLMAENIKKGYVDISKIRYVDKLVDERNARARVQVGDILISIKGTLGEVAAAEESLLPANLSRDVAILKPLEKDYDTSFITLFLMSKYGAIQSIRGGSGGVQQMITLQRLRQFIIPKFSIVFRGILSEFYKKSLSKRQYSSKIYIEAETLLLQTLDLEDFEEKQKENLKTNYNSKSFKESFLSSGRLDAEYYQSKYEALENYLDKFERIEIAELINYPVSSGSTPKAGGDAYTNIDLGIPFIRAVDLVNSQVSTDNFIYIKKEIHNGILKKTQLKKDDVLFSIAGTVGRCAIFDHDFEANINQAVSILRFDEVKILRLYSVMFFNSWIGKMYIQKYSRQGLQTNLNLQEVSSLKIPILPKETQTQISNLVQESFTLRQESETLLEKAKQAVELAIEESEEVAMAFLQS